MIQKKLHVSHSVDFVMEYVAAGFSQATEDGLKERLREIMKMSREFVWLAGRLGVVLVR